MRIFIFLYLLIIPTLLFSQEKTTSKGSLDMNTKYSSITDTVKKKKAKIAKIDGQNLLDLGLMI